MQVSETFELVSDVDGLKLSGYYCVDFEHVCGVIQLVHGMAEHKERYYDFIKYLCGLGYACVIMDTRGHGASLKHEDDLGYFYDTKGEACVRDIHQVERTIRKHAPNVPFILFGHSMGSLIVRSYLKHYGEVDGLIVCGSPSKNVMAPVALRLVQCMKKINGDHFRSKLIHQLAFSSYSKKFDENYSENVWLSKNRENVITYDRDPLCGYIFTLNGFENLFHFLIRAYDKEDWNIKHPNIPILFIAGKDDPCIVSEVAFAKAVKVMKDVGYTDVESHLCDGLRHEILFECEYQSVYAYIKDWLDRKERIK